MLKKEDKLKILATQEDAAFERMSEVSPADDDFFKSVQAVHAIRQLAEVVAYTDEPSKVLEDLHNIADRVEDLAVTNTPANATFPEPKAVEDTAEVPEELPGQMTTDALAVEKPISKEDLRVELYALGQKGVQVLAIMPDMGYAKLSEVPAERYGELLKMAREAQ